VAEFFVIHRSRGFEKDQVAVDSTDDLVTRARHGDSDAFSLLYRHYVQSIYRYIYARVNNNTQQAEDLTQEVFLKALDKLDGYQFKGKPFSSWLFRIAHNLVIDYYRQMNKNTAATTSLNDSSVIVSTEDPVASAEQSMAVKALNEAVSKLPDRQKNVIILRFSGGLSVAETANVLGTSQGTVKKLQNVALGKLKDYMKR
jgi:RNA polymerase sigma-70 factor (ECF subfamily)